MRKVALGRLGLPAKEFYVMTLAELFDAIDGHQKQDSERLEFYLWGVRKQIYFQLLSNGAKDVKEEDIISLSLDEKAREDRLKNMPQMTFTEHAE